MGNCRRSRNHDVPRPHGRRSPEVAASKVFSRGLGSSWECVAARHFASIAKFQEGTIEMSNSNSSDEKNRAEQDAISGRRTFLKGAAISSVLGAVAPAMIAKGQSAVQGSGQETRAQLKTDMMGGIEDDIKKDLDMRAQSTEELPTPKNLKYPGMLDGRFPIYYKISVPQAMGLLTTYFAA